MYDFAERADVQMHVCGACGLRDPFEPCERQVQLSSINSQHWLKPSIKQVRDISNISGDAFPRSASIMD